MLLGLAGVLAPGVVLSQTAPAYAPNPKALQEYAKLEAKATRETGPKQAETLAKLAELDFTFGHDGLMANQDGAGQRYLDQAGHHADQAVALLQQEVALGKTNGMKNVEVSLQKITYGLKQLAEEVRFTQRPPVQSLAQHFADLRAQLLNWMFAPKKKA